MRLFYVREGGYVGALFTGKTEPIDGLVKKYSFKTTISTQFAGPIYSLELTEEGNRCIIDMSFSRKTKRIMIRGMSNNQKFLSGKINGMLAEVEATDLPEEEQWAHFLMQQPFLREDVRDYRRT